ncbi:MAG: hypothetical protein ABMB14_02540 [Myxococcota bacterium]
MIRSSMGRGAIAVALAAALGSAVGGCSHNCQDSCARLYDPAQCGIAIPGVSLEDSRGRCEESCETALKNSGPMGEYNPYNRANPSDPPELGNERQAAEWMDCVWAVECSELDPVTGICAPVTF